jgi:hypothetical protein
MTAALVLVLPFVWTACCGISLAMGIWALQDAREDLATKRSSGINGVVEIVGRSNVRREIGRIYVQFIFVTVGILAILGPFDANLYPNIVTRAFTAFGFISVAISMAVDRIMDRRVRIQITRILRGPASDPKIVVKGAAQ